MRVRTSLAPIAAATIVLVVASGMAAAATWSPTRTLQGVFGVSSPPEVPVVAVNAAGHTVALWDSTGAIRFAEKTKSGAWTPSARVVPGANGGPVAVAIGPDETTAVAWTTVATRYVPSKLLVTVRSPGATAFPTPVEVAPGAGVWYFKLGVAGDGAVTLLWSGAGVRTSSVAPGGTWSSPLTLAPSGNLPDLVVNDAGAALAVWQQGAPDQIVAAYRPAGGPWDAAQVVSAAAGRSTWNPKPGIDAAGDAVVGYLDGTTMVTAAKPAGGVWGAPVDVSPATQGVYYPALAMDGAGDVLAAWQALDAGNNGTIYARWLPAGGTWGAMTPLSGPQQSADRPTAALSGDGAVGAVTWTDDLGQKARTATGPVGGVWTKAAIGPGYYGLAVPVAAGGGIVGAAWAAVGIAGNPNSAKLLGKTFA